MNARYTLQQVADYFISWSNETEDAITNLKLQKLVYYAQTWFLGHTQSALFAEDVQAWVHGPVVPELYQQYKQHGWRPIQREDLGLGSFEGAEASFDAATRAILADVRNHYAAKGAFELELLTHRQLPWYATRNGLPEDAPCTAVIPKELMMQWASQQLQAQ